MVIARLAAAGTAHASLNEVAGPLRHPQLRRVEALAPSGPAALPASPVRCAGTTPATGEPPVIGAHSAGIRAEFG